MGGAGCWWWAQSRAWPRAEAFWCLFLYGEFLPFLKRGVGGCTPLETCEKGQDQHHNHLTPFPIQAAVSQGGQKSVYVDMNAAGDGHEVHPPFLLGMFPTQCGSPPAEPTARKVLIPQHLKLKAAACPPSSSQATASLAEK